MIGSNLFFLKEQACQIAYDKTGDKAGCRVQKQMERLESGNKQLYDDTCDYTNDCSSGIGAFGKHAQHEQSSHTAQYEPEYLVKFVPQ